MKRKIFIFLICIAMLVSSLSVSAFALTADDYGANYDSTHKENGCCQVGSDIHYDQGYEDGLLDGEPSAEEIEGYKQQAIDSYLKSAEYLNALAENYNSAYEDGQNAMLSDMQSQLDESYDNGVADGYEAGYNGAYDETAEKMYSKGLADGYADYRNSTEYAESLSAYHQKGYTKGYKEGYADGYDVGLDDSIDPSSFFAVLFSIIGVIILLFVGTYFMSKNKKKRKR